jgi:RNA polymerase sigma-70 factor (ECF subfamily)
MSAAPHIFQDLADAGTAVDLGDAFRRHRKGLKATALRVLRRNDDVDDLVQDVFVEALLGVRNLRTPDALGSWLRRVMIRVAYRRRSVPGFIGYEDAPGCQQAGDERGFLPDPLALTTLESVMASFPAERRLAWALRYVDGVPLEPIAARFGCSLATIKRRISEVHAALEGALYEQVPACGERGGA